MGRLASAERKGSMPELVPKKMRKLIEHHVFPICRFVKSCKSNIMASKNKVSHGLRAIKKFIENTYKMKTTIIPKSIKSNTDFMFVKVMQQTESIIGDVPPDECYTT